MSDSESQSGEHEHSGREASRDDAMAETSGDDAAPAPAVKKRRSSMARKSRSGARGRGRSRVSRSRSKRRVTISEEEVFGSVFQSFEFWLNGFALRTTC